MKIQAGDKFRVKSTPINRQYGVRCSNTWESQNNKVWPKEIGEVEIRQGNGWQGMYLEFSQGRSLAIGTLYSDSTEWEIDMERMEDFVKVKEGKA